MDKGNRPSTRKELRSLFPRAPVDEEGYVLSYHPDDAAQCTFDLVFASLTCFLVSVVEYLSPIFSPLDLEFLNTYGFCVVRMLTEVIRRPF